jgi:glycosyltransferase involved in cell wall biosynthesis
MTQCSNELITVIIPTYNRGNFISKSINSVLSQTYSNFELIIVDDASTDNTENIVRGNKDSRIRYFKLEFNSKGTKPRNIGIQMAKGEYIAFLDSDDEWINDKLEKQLDFLRQFDSKKMVCFTGLILKEGLEEYPSQNRELKSNEDIMDYILLDDNWVQTSTYMISSEIAKNTMFGSDVRKHQDWDFCLRLRNNGAKFAFLPDHLTIYNIEKRTDRIGNNLKYQLSLDWASSIKGEVSEKAYYAFLSKIVASQLILNGQGLEPFKIYCRAFFKRSIKFWPFLKGIIKSILPWHYIKRIMKKSLITGN